MSESEDRKYFTYPRVHEYRGQVKVAAWYYKSLSIILSVFLVFLLSLFFFLSQDSDIETLINGILFFSLWLSLVYLNYVYILWPMSISKIQVYNDYILINRKKEKIFINFKDVERFNYSINKTFGGWFTLVMRNGRKYRFSVMVERVEYIIEKVYERRPDIITFEKFSKLRRKLILSDHSLTRFYDFFKKKLLLLTLFHSFLLPTLFCGLLFYKQNSDFIINSYFSYFFSLSFKVALIIIFAAFVHLVISNTLINLHFNRILKKFPENKIRDLKFERRVYRFSFPSYLMCLICAFAFIYQTNINSYDTVVSAMGNRVWYDMRYNCIKCGHNLQINDTIISEDNNLFKLVHMPENETTSVQLRSTASEGKNFIFVLNLKTNKVQKIEKIKIKGKVTDTMFIDL
jgi:hypothetical protein